MKSKTLRMSTVSIFFTRYWLPTPLLMLCVLCVFLICSCGHKAELQEEAKPTVVGNVITFPAASPAIKNIQTAIVAGPRERELNIPGRLVWDEDHTVRVFTPFAGRVSRLVANVGDKVIQGQVLAELQSPDFAAAQADARKAQSMLTLAKQALGRVKELAANGVSAGKDLQQTEADYANAEAEARRTQARLKLYGNTQNIDQKFNLVSPLAGTVVERNLNPGQELRPDQPSAPQFVVTDPSKLWVQLDAAEADLKQLKPGAAVLISSNQYPDDAFAGEIKQIADYIDPVTRTLKIRGVVSNLDRRLKAEMFVTARVALAKSEYPTVPENAVFLEGIRRFVFVKTSPEKFTRRGIKVAMDSTNTVAAQNGLKVLSGLQEGDEVVVSGNLFMQQMVAAERMNDEVNGKRGNDVKAAEAAPSANTAVTATPAITDIKASVTKP
jgi:cobalt-zinc-cadmium efflux system membrane fusion protein